MPRIFTLLAWFVVVTATSAVAAQDPLHQQIDAQIAAKSAGKVNGPASDAEFVRRVYLDLIGRIPTRDEATKFFADAADTTNKTNNANNQRAKLIDALLASPEHPRHLANVFHVMLTERLFEHPEWNAWLLESFQKNKPWNTMASEMLAPHLDDDPARGAGAFVAKRLENYGQNPVDYPALVRDVGRLFLGVDLQCAQCHDHIHIDDYKQVDYQGLYAYFQNTSLLGGAKFPAVEERPTTMKIEFQSVFVMGKHQVGPRIPFTMETTIPMLEKGQEFATPPDKQKQFPGVLKFSPLRILANDLPRAETPGFAKNAVNRLWWLMLGRGQVQPLDLAHKGNPPSHPELLEALTNDFVAHQFDLRYVLREVALSETYQRSSQLPADAGEVPPQSYRVALEKGLSPEQMASSLWTATGPWPDEKPLADLRTRCVKALAQPAREPETEFAPSVKGALFLSHDTAVLGLLERRDGNLVDRLLKLEDAKQQVQEAYLAVLSREPSETERADLIAFVTQGSAAKEQTIKQLVWALLASNEFCLNH